METCSDYSDDGEGESVESPEVVSDERVLPLDPKELHQAIVQGNQDRMRHYYNEQLPAQRLGDTETKVRYKE